MTALLATKPGSARRWAAALGLIAVALGGAALLWGAAETTAHFDTVLVGHAQASVDRTLTSRDPVLVGLAIGVLAGGAAVAVALVGRARADLVAATLVAALAAGTFFVTRDASPAEPSRGVLSRTTYGTTTNFAEAMRIAGIGCDATRPAPIADGAARAITCSVPWNADIRDGHDDVFVAVWRSGDPGRWLRDNVASSTPAVAGRDWIATCEFRSTCAMMGDRLREVDR